MGKRLLGFTAAVAVLVGLCYFVVKSNSIEYLKDDILFSFSVTADSQIDINNQELTQQDKKWMVNTRVFTRMVREIQAQEPKMLFFCGDSVWGDVSGDMNEMNKRYSFWRGAVAPLFETGTYVFPVPGNHEMQEYEKNTGTYRTTAAKENSWRDNMGDIIPDKKRWESIFGGLFNGSSWSDLDYAQVDYDNITSDQSKLSYSFDYKGSHFIIINTFAGGNESHAPIMRLREDIFDAKRRGVKHIFIFGHQPAYTFKFDSSTDRDGLDVDEKSRDEFWELVNESKATYFCGHQHLFNTSQPGGKKAYQVITGPAGGGFKAKEPVRNPDLLKYSWVTVKVHTNGEVHLDAYGFDKEYGDTRVLKCWSLEKGF